MRVLGRDVAERAGASGFVFRVGDGVVEKAGSLPAKMTIDYSSFAGAYGGDYAQRLRLRVLPDCAAKDPLPRDCRTGGQDIPIRNDVTTHTLVADLQDLAKLARQGVGSGSSASDAAGAVFAVMSASDGGTGTFTATPMALSGSWQVAPGSGEFNYSYPIKLPTPAGGSAPSVGLSYSSGAIDGLTSAANTQASEVGLGWSTFGNAFIERSYGSCIDTELQSQDLCWAGENATISLGGISGPMIPLNPQGTRWQLLSDPGWRIERDNDAYTWVGNETQFRQRWKVTGPDGTIYWFGFGHGPGTFTNSVLGIDVFGDDPGEPCYGVNGSAWEGHCRQEWRWYLDRVEDRDGNVTTYVYQKESNFYSPRNGTAYNGFNFGYDRSAFLTQILYGGHVNYWDHKAYSARVVFNWVHRCVNFDSSCPAPPQSQANLLYPDVPLDLVCGSGLGNCGVHSPSFFSSIRYTDVLTQVKKGGSPNGSVDDNWLDVTKTVFGQHFAAAPGVVWPSKLVLDSIQHWGVVGPDFAYPATQLEYAYLQNRVDVADPNSEAAMRNLRLTRIVNPSGGVTQINYGQKNPCPTDYNPGNNARWDLNVRDCFPQPVVDNGHRRTGVFNKWLVGQVVERPGNGSPDMWTGYLYEGDPAWAFDNASFLRNDQLIGWQLWRGYGESVVTKGTEQQVLSFDGESKTRIRVYRGMNRDRQLEPIAGGAGNIISDTLRQVSVRSFDNAPFPDDLARAGRTVEEQRLGTLGTITNTPVTSTLFKYESRKTHDEANSELLDAYWVGVSEVTERVYDSPNTPKERQSITTYTPTPPVIVGSPQPPPPQPSTTTEKGWLGVIGDERCSSTTYANNPTAWMWVYPARNEVVAGDSCDPAATRVSVNETYYDGNTTNYDGSTAPPAPARGNPTRQRTLIEGSRWSQTRTEFDELGRIKQVTDPNGKVTTTTYKVDLVNDGGVADEIEDTETAGSPAVAIPAKITVTNPLGHKLVSYPRPEFNALDTEFDANGNPTTYTYDSFGNLTSVRLATEHGNDDQPSWQFSYDIANKVIRTRQLTSTAAQGTGVVFEDSWTVYDGFWRERQTQTPSPVAGKVIVAEKSYDERGLLRDEWVAQALDGTPGGFINRTNNSGNDTLHTYDKLGREIKSEWRQSQQNPSATTTSYGVDSVTVTGPTGQVARSTVDAFGRTIESAEKDGSTWAASTMKYDAADRLLEVKDPEGNAVSYSYLMTGWKLGQTDPDRGGAIYSYDDAGNNISTLTSGFNVVATKYDDLNRPVERHSGSATGPLLATWTYDTAPRGVGKPHKETTFTAGGNWVSEVTGYDTRGRATGSKLTVPSGIPGLSGSYSTAQTYDRADRVRTLTYPAIGGLAGETVTTDYSNQGLPISMTGQDPYVRGVTYDDRGRASTISFGPNSWMAKSFAYDADQRLKTAETKIVNNGVSQTVAKHDLAYFADGNLKTHNTALNGTNRYECFAYDARGRLAKAATTPTATVCDTIPSIPGGTQAYKHEYSFSPAGNQTRRVETNAAGTATTTAYTYPAAGQARPHAPTRIGADTYQWDERGNLATRTVGGASETLSWDVQGRLASVSGTSFIYNPSGQRMLRKTPSGTTLYFAGHEVTVDAAGAVLNAVRSYTFGGQLIATRKAGTPAPDYISSDPSGSLELAIPSGGTAATSTRSYLPYGKVRSETGDLATDKGFVGQIEDASTSLSYLNARYYDAKTGVFISTDPLMNPKSPKSLNPYSYAEGNPATLSDPSGMSPAYIYGLESENMALRDQNKALLDHIGRLNSQLQEMQGIIEEQQRYINDLLTHIDALTAIIYEQQAIIDQLQARVSYLERVVQQQRNQINALQAKVKYYEGVITQLVVHTFEAPRVLPLLADIFAGKGITSWEGSKVTGLQNLVSGLFTALVNLDSISNLRISYLENDLELMRVQRNIYYYQANYEHESTMTGGAKSVAVGVIPLIGGLGSSLITLTGMRDSRAPLSPSLISPDMVIVESGDFPEGTTVVTGEPASSYFPDPPDCNAWDHNEGFC